MEPVYIVVITSDLDSDAMFATYQLRDALWAIAALQTVVPSLTVSLYMGTSCVLRVIDGRWSVPMTQKVQAA